MTRIPRTPSSPVPVVVHRDAVSGTHRMPPRPADELHREALLLLLENPTLLRETQKLVPAARDKLRTTLRRPSRPIPIVVGDATPEGLADALVSRVARTIRMFPVRREVDFRQQADRFADLFGHVTPADYTGPGAIDAEGMTELALQARLASLDVEESARQDILKIFAEATGTYNGLIQENAITIGEDDQPTLDDVRSDIPADFTDTFRPELQQLEEQILSAMRAVGNAGADGVMSEKGFRAEPLMEAMETLMMDMTRLFNRLGGNRQFPQIPEAVRAAVDKEAVRYGGIKKSMMAILFRGSKAEEARIDLVQQLQETTLDEETRSRIPVFADSLAKTPKGETTEELSDHVVENILTLELRQLLEKGRKEGAADIDAITHKFYVLVSYHLRHLKNSLGGQLANILMTDPGEDDEANGISSRMIDWKCDEEVNDETHRAQVTATLLTTLNKSLRAVRILRYIQAFLGTNR